MQTPKNQFLADNFAVGKTIVIHAWGQFSEKKMVCTGIDTSEYAYGDNYRFVFSDGIELDKAHLLNQFKLWDSRNGFDII